MNEGAQYSLSIRFSSDGFSLSVYDELIQLLTFKKVATLLFALSVEDIIKLLIEETETLLNIRTIRLIFESDNYSFVPTAIFKEEEASLFLLLQNKLENNESVLFNRLPQWDMVNVFSIPNALNEALSEHFPDLLVEHHLSYFLTDKIKQQNESSVQIWIRPKVLDAVVLIKGDLILINSYVYSSSEDFVYFTLNIFEQLSLDSEKTEVILFNVPKLTDLQNLIQKYVKTVNSYQ